MLPASVKSGSIAPLADFSSYNQAAGAANSDDSDSDADSDNSDPSRNNVDDEEDDEIDSTIDPEADLDDDDDVDEYISAELADIAQSIDDDDDEPPDHQKVDTTGFRESILQSHAELVQHSYEEIESRCRIVRNADGMIDDPLHRTAPFITKFEHARIIGERAKQLDANAEAFVDVPATVIDSYTIAMQEYAEKKIPFIIKRPMPNGEVEYWKLADFEM